MLHRKNPQAALGINEVGCSRADYQSTRIRERKKGNTAKPVPRSKRIKCVRSAHTF